MNAELISVGTELLLGEILNTDAQFLSAQLSELGINVYYQTVVGDNWNRLKETVMHALDRADIIITSGGLGPTPDDLTKEVLAECMESPLVMHEESLNAMKEYFQKINREMVKSNEKQALMPENCMVLENTCGTAPGAIIEKNGKIVIMLPGPPNELQEMYKLSVKPFLQTKSDSIFYSRVLNIAGIGESAVAEKIQGIIINSTNPTVAPYAKIGETRLRITAKCKDEAEGESLISPVETLIKDVLGDDVYGIDRQTLPEVVYNIVKENNFTIAAAESCTGGMFVKMITDIAGSSEVLNESLITYANDAKRKYLFVKEDTLTEFGAVSEEVAREMAEGIRRQAGADIGVGITGIAGPGGGTEEKPVGLVYIGVSVGDSTFVNELRLGGDRDKVRYTTCINAFDMVRRILQEKY